MYMLGMYLYWILFYFLNIHFMEDEWYYLELQKYFFQFNQSPHLLWQFISQNLDMIK
jgi:hypothetical protein